MTTFALKAAVNFLRVFFIIILIKLTFLNLTSGINNAGYYRLQPEFLVINGDTMITGLRLTTVVQPIVGLKPFRNPKREL